MKKVNGLLILACVVSVCAVGIAIGMIVGVTTGDEYPVAVGVSVGIVAIAMLAATSPLTIGTVLKKMAKKTMKGLDEMNFAAAGTFYAGNVTIKIDVLHGKIAYVSALNPKALQIISAAQIENICSDYQKGPFGGTGYVYFQFHCNGKKVRIPTFVSRQMYSLKSEAVMTAISKADTYAGYLKQAKENAANA